MMERYRFAIISVLLALALVVQGCGKGSPPPIVPAQGVVLLGGAPLAKAQVRFIPQIAFGAECIATAVTDEQGKFTLQCGGKPGACATESVVLVGEADIPPKLQVESAQRELAVYLRSLKNRPIPPQYASPATSPLKVTVSEGQSEYKLELKR